MKAKIFLIILIISIGNYSISNAQEVQQKIPEKIRILFLLDGSGSMLAEWKDELRIDVAKRILSNLVDSLRANKNIELALRVYGHRYSLDSKNCQDTRLEVPFSPNNHDQINLSLKNIKPRGTTPIAYSLEQAANDFPQSEEYRNIIIIITDGIESCDGDPCAVSAALQSKEIFLKPFIVGIGDLNDEFKKQFSCVGKYYNAEDEHALQQSLTDVIKTTLAKTTATVELQNNNGNNSYTNVNVTFLNDFTNTAAFDFIHYLDRSNRPDTVQVDPVLSYNIVVNTLPAVFKRNINIIPGRHNHIEIKTPQGDLRINQKGSNAYPYTVQAIMKKANGEIFHIQNINSQETYLEGSYDIIITTIPRKTYRINVSEGKTETINLPDPGIANLINSGQGYGSLYEIRADNKQEWVADIDPTKNQTSLVLQPGNYKLVFRRKNALGSKFTNIQHFQITSGKSVSLQL